MVITLALLLIFVVAFAIIYFIYENARLEKKNKKLYQDLLAERTRQRTFVSSLEEVAEQEPYDNNSCKQIYCALNPPHQRFFATLFNFSYPWPLF